MLGSDLNLDLTRSSFALIIMIIITSGARCESNKIVKSVRFRLPRAFSTHKSVEIKEKRERKRKSGGAARDDMVAKARDQTGMIITRVVNTSLDVILF